MDQLQISELKNSYYEYIAKIPLGLQRIIDMLANNQLEEAFNGIADLAEGLEFLLKVEQGLKENGFTINSRINEIPTMYKDINESLAKQDYILLKDLLEYELLPMFVSATEWVFQKEVN